MAIINVEGLGQVEIAGNAPTLEEQQGIIEALKNLENQDNPSNSNSNQQTRPILNLNKKKPEGLELIGGRPTFEAAGGVFGSVLGTPLGLPGIVTAGTLSTAGAGQLYDVVQGFLTDQPRTLEGQLSTAFKDLKREAVFQTLFAKIPGAGRYLKSKLVNKDAKTKSLYQSAKAIGFPLSISDTGTPLAKGYNRVIGVFPFVGTPTKKQFAAKANILNKYADDTLNTFAPNVTLTNLGIDMFEAAKATRNEFKRVTSFFYDDFYKTASKIKEPVISTQNFSNAAKSYVKLVEDGLIRIKGKTTKSPQKDSIYKYAKSIQNIDPFINIAQYKAIVRDMNKFSKLSQKEGYDLSQILSMKTGIEKDLNLLTKPEYYKQFSKVVDVRDMVDLANKLKFANKVFSNGLENSMITKVMRDRANKDGIKLTNIRGQKIFERGAAKYFERVDKAVFGSGFEKPGGLYADQLGEALLKNQNLTPLLLDDLSALVGKKNYDKFVRKVFQKAYDKSLIDNGTNGLMFDPFKYEDLLGLNTEGGRDIIKKLLKNSKLSIDKLDNFFNIAKNHGSITIPDVSQFVARRATLGGSKSILGGVALGYGTFNDPVRGLGLIYLARKGSGILSDPKNLDLVMNSLDFTAPNFQVYNSILKLTDNLIKDETNTPEAENNFRAVREFLELNKEELLKKFKEENVD
jgi:hypothetical protein